MRRRIERSRARCERAATSHKPLKEEGTNKQSKLTALAPLESDTKND
jgi:hypothetical protein